MPILKFWKKEENIVLDKLRMEDITEDQRTSLVNKSSFMNHKYRIDDNVYMALNDMFFKMSKLFNRTQIPINAMLIRNNNAKIIIVPSRSYVFWNGKSVEPEKYNILQTEQSIQEKLQTV
jgi:hypothetical protein